MEPRRQEEPLHAYAWKTIREQCGWKQRAQNRECRYPFCSFAQIVVAEKRVAEMAVKP